mgnify:CR=1 FL=1
MSRKSKILPYKTIDQGSLATAQIIGKTTTVKETDVVQVNFEWSGAIAGLSGTIGVQATMSEDPTSPNAVWFDLDFGAVPPVTGASGKHQLIITQVSFLHIRPVYNKTGGSTGTLDATLFATTRGA